MVKIRILVSLAGPNFSYQAGQIVEVTEELAADLIRAGHAVKVEEIETATVEVPEKAVARQKRVK